MCVEIYVLFGNNAYPFVKTSKFKNQTISKDVFSKTLFSIIALLLLFADIIWNL